MDEAYREYLELFAYFGRGATARLQRDEYEALSREFTHLLALRPDLSAEQVQRVIELRDLLLSDRPRLNDLLQGK